MVKSAVLGKQVLAEVWADQDRLELPSYVTMGPKKLGTADGRLTADRARSTATIHLVITLIRLWGFAEGREKEMLDNFMHLISALWIASKRAISDADIDRYTYHFRSYLEGYVKLYKEVNVPPNSHMCLHLGMFLRLYGPVHSWRAWVFERFNYLMKRTKTNSHFGKQFIFIPRTLANMSTSGQMEQTFMQETCAAANLTALFQDIDLPADIRKQVLPELQKAFDSDNRGTRLSDGLALGSIDTIRFCTSSSRKFPVEVSSLVLKHFGEQYCRIKGTSNSVC